MKNKTIYLFLFLLFILLEAVSFAGEPLDIESLPSLRMKQYSADPHKKIVVFSAPRTGSSLTYNIFRFLFEKSENISSFHNSFDQNCLVLKTHKFAELELLEDKNVLYIVTIRNPIDAIISNYRISPQKIKNIGEFTKNLMQKHKEYLLFCEQLKESGNTVIFIKYEDFKDDFEVIFQMIQNHFSLVIEDLDKELIQKGYAKENVHFFIEGFSSFKEYLPISGFHGKHVTLDSYTPPKELVYWLNTYLDEIKPVFSKYGYFSD